MEIRYSSTRGGENQITASQAILKGLAKDSGLFVPDRFPQLTYSFSELAELSYPEVALAVLRLFLTDYTEEELRFCITHAYDAKFDDPEIVPIHQADDTYYMELFHGRTLAFKDLALSILPYLLTTAAKKNDIHQKIVILTATSGDTGKAALEGFADVPGTAILVFYPKEGVSTVQEQQMRTQMGQNTYVFGIHGNFDDAQTAVKSIFQDERLRAELMAHGVQFSSANSINIGRLIPQIVYYVYGYIRLIKQKVLAAGDPINITVPTGNFGNILAAYYAKKIGLPVQKLLCASNSNKVLFDFFTTGTYDRNRPFVVTSSPSMDILISSNLERLLYDCAGENAEETAKLMESLQRGGVYHISDTMREKLQDFYGSYATEDQVRETIRRLYEQDGYLIDPHTAVAATVYAQYRKETGDQTPTLLAATASPFKFGESVLCAVDAERYADLSPDAQFSALQELSGIPLPAPVQGLFQEPIRHQTVLHPEEMEQTIRTLFLSA